MRGESADDVGSLIGLRASVLELGPRASEDMLPTAIVTHVHEARARRCGALSAGGQGGQFVTRVRELAVAIEAGDRQRARTLVSSLDEPSEISAPQTSSRPGLDHDEKKDVSP